MFADVEAARRRAATAAVAAGGGGGGGGRRGVSTPAAASAAAEWRAPVSLTRSGVSTAVEQWLLCRVHAGATVAVAAFVVVALAVLIDTTSVYSSSGGGGGVAGSAAARALVLAHAHAHAHTHAHERALPPADNRAARRVIDALKASMRQHEAEDLVFGRVADTAAAAGAGISAAAGSRPCAVTESIAWDARGAPRRLVHFVWSGRRRNELAYLQYHVFKAASKMLAGGPVVLHLLYADAEPFGEWWERSREFVLVQRVAEHVREFVEARPSLSVAFVSDYVRLHALHQHGGLYLDTDIVALQPMDELFASTADLLLGIEAHTDASITAFTNAVIFARPCSPAVRAWLDTLEAVPLDEWATMGTLYGVVWARVYAEFAPDSVLVLPRQAFYYPSFTDLDMIFGQPEVRLDSLPALALHVWNRAAADAYAGVLENFALATKSSSLFGDVVRWVGAL